MWSLTCNRPLSILLLILRFSQLYGHGISCSSSCKNGFSFVAAVVFYFAVNARSTFLFGRKFCVLFEVYSAGEILFFVSVVRNGFIPLSSFPFLPLPSAGLCHKTVMGLYQFSVELSSTTAKVCSSLDTCTTGQENLWHGKPTGRNLASQGAIQEE
jgi:hypothetical protein